MRRVDYDDEPTVIIERTSGGVGSFLLGVAIGAAAALLLAPQSGAATRRDLRRGARRAKRAAQDEVRVLLFLQHSRTTVFERTEPGEDAKKVASCAALAGIEVADQFETLRSFAVANPGALDDLYLEGDGFGQMTSTGNWHAADLVARALNR